MSINKSRVKNPAGNALTINLDVNDTTIWNKAELYKFLAEHQGKPIDINIPEGPCLRSLGVFDILDQFELKAVTIHTLNFVQEDYSYYQYNYNQIPSLQYFNIPLNSNYTEYHHWNKKKIFGAFYNRPTWARIGLAGHLGFNYWGQTNLNFRFNPHDQDQRPLFDMQKLFDVDPQSVNNFLNIQDQLPVQLEDKDGYTVDGTVQEHTDQLSCFYPDFLIDVVVETFLQGRSFYPTEKTIRPMLLKKPFIHMGPKCFLIHLRQMGFQTFHEFWDEDYDGHGMKQRYERILTLIDSLAVKSTDELEDMYNRMQPILDHNHNLMLTRGWKRDITYVE